jgi:hypothetical protein
MNEKRPRTLDLRLRGWREGEIERWGDKAQEVVSQSLLLSLAPSLPLLPGLMAEV